MKKMLRAWGAAVATAGALVATMPAQAAVVIASFDPAVGPEMPGVGFSGTAQFFVPNGCLVVSGLVNNSHACSSNSMVVQTATLNFYDLSNPLTILSSITFSPSVLLNSVEVVGGQVVAADSPFLGPDVDPLIPGFDGTVSFRFVIDNTTFGPGNGVDLQLCPTGEDCVLSPNRARARFTTVPEPAPLALAGLAALVGFAGSRRRRAARV